jgi:molybdopterin converting factor small subunit
MTVFRPVGRPTVEVTVRFFAGAGAAAGTAQEQIVLQVPARLDHLVAELIGRHGAGLERVLTAATLLVNEVAGVPDQRLDDGSLVDVLPPFAGG